jgi:ketosteroid isomerase-like protein
MPMKFNAGRRKILKLALVALVVFLFPRNGNADAVLRHSVDARSNPTAVHPSRDSSAVARTIDQFHAALAAGDPGAALALLASDAIIMEAGDIQSKAEYAAHHLQEDIAFSKAIASTRSSVRVVVDGNVAWASSTSVTEGWFNGRAINSAGAELVVLSRVGAPGKQPGRWRIRAIHWSSRRRAQ